MITKEFEKNKLYLKEILEDWGYPENKKKLNEIAEDEIKNEINLKKFERTEFDMAIMKELEDNPDFMLKMVHFLVDLKKEYKIVNFYLNNAIVFFIDLWLIKENNGDYFKSKEQVYSDYNKYMKEFGINFIEMDDWKENVCLIGTAVWMVETFDLLRDTDLENVEKEDEFELEYDID